MGLPRECLVVLKGTIEWLISRFIKLHEILDFEFFLIHVLLDFTHFDPFEAFTKI